LAIKIRSTEELDQINDDNLKDEKNRLVTGSDCFQILEYIRSSIEIIMNLKIEDLEKNDQKRQTRTKTGQEQQTSPLKSQAATSRQGHETDISLSGITVESHNLILQSMKDALIHMIENNETSDSVDAHPGATPSHEGNQSKAKKKVLKSRGPPLVYEKILQKLEADIRGHIRLEHEMKIHMDYLEGKVEKLQKDLEENRLEQQATEGKVEELMLKAKVLGDERDQKDLLIKQKKKQNDELAEKLKELEQKNEQMTLKIE